MAWVPCHDMPMIYDWWVHDLGEKVKQVYYCSIMLATETIYAAIGSQKPGTLSFCV